VKHSRLNQADFSSLISGALGSDFATNSIGKFPTFIWKDLHFAYSSLKANYFQLLELLKTKKSKVKAERNFPLLDFPKEAYFSLRLRNSEEAMRNGNSETAVSFT
jgi:hypothetical protein